jgi:hypothetical protein
VLDLLGDDIGLTRREIERPVLDVDEEPPSTT